MIIMAASLSGAATWYVDSAASGANNGTSWANAWTAIGSATGGSVNAGDTVYISGGASGTTNTYASFSPKYGTVGSPITYQIGQTSGHNGNCQFTGSGTFFSSIPHDVVLSGDAGDGQMHFQWSGYSMLIDAQNGGANNYRLTHCNFGIMTGGGTGSRVIYCDNQVNDNTNDEVDHDWFKEQNTDAAGDCVILFNAGQSHIGYDTALKLHNNIIYTFWDITGGGNLGPDALKLYGNGNTWHDNYIQSLYYAAGQSGEHQDGMQGFSLCWFKGYNNVIVDTINSGFVVNEYYGPITNGIFANNIIAFTSSTPNSFNEGGSVGLATANHSVFQNIAIVNNLIAGGTQNWSENNSQPGTYAGTWVNCRVANNISIQGGVQTQDTVEGVITNANYDSMTLGTATNSFTTYGGVLNGTNNNFRLSIGASVLIGKGTNLTSYLSAYGITNDFDGNTRPATGNWDIGPFQYYTNNIGSAFMFLPTSTAEGLSVLDVFRP